jgi:hypothetical protein
MEERLSTVGGKIVEFISNDSIAVLQTKFGLAYIMVEGDYEYHLKINDEIYLEDADYVFLHGQVVTMIDDKICINGTLHQQKRGWR